MTPDTETIAAEALSAFDSHTPIEPFTSRDPGFDVQQAYAVAAARHRLRLARGEKLVGRKIGFTNRGIWDEYNVDAPIWGYMYAHGVAPLDRPLSLAQFCEPKIEPELALALAKPPKPGMDERDLLDCVGWIAHGFEVVQSVYPDWKFKGADTIANFGLHGAYRIGPALAVTADNRAQLFECLNTFTVTLFRDGEEIDKGCGSNVLDGPLSALRHLIDVLANDSANPPLAAGEIVTTGTLTRAFPVRDGETWSTGISGIPLSGIGFRFG
jgi:2-oxo-3-hexenedioate decarboxylase